MDILDSFTKVSCELNDSLDSREGDESEEKSLEALEAENQNVKINKIQMIGSGTQADVYTCTLHNSSESPSSLVYVTKTKKIVDN